MTWAPLETQKKVFQALSGDQTLMTLLGSPIRSEKQTLTFSSAPATGDFKITYGAQTTAAILAAADMSSGIQSALALLTGLVGITVVKTSALVYTITFPSIVDEPLLGSTANTLENITPVAVTATFAETIKGGTSLNQKVFDLVPDDTQYPYIVMYILPFNERGNHTKEGWGCELQISCFYQPGKNGNTARGYAPVQAIQNRIDVLLHLSDLCMEGWNNLGLRRTLVDIFTLEDNVTLNGIQRFNLLLGEA